MMTKEYFETIAQELNQEIVYLEYRWKLSFWNVDLESGKFGNFARRAFSRVTREVTTILGKFLPKNTKLYSPWFVYVGKAK
jgi:hypothetical protein